MAQYAELYPDILPHVLSCPVPSVNRALSLVAQDFFQRSEAYTHRIPAVTTTEYVANIAVSIPEDTRLVVPLTMHLDGERLSTTNQDILALEYGDWESLSGTPRFVMIDDTISDELVLALPPDGEYELTGRVAVKPVRSATGVSDAMMELYGDALVSGVLYRLMMMKNTEWYDPKLAQYHANEYERAIEEAHRVSTKGNTSRLLATGYGGL